MSMAGEEDVSTLFAQVTIISILTRTVWTDQRSPCCKTTQWKIKRNCLCDLWRCCKLIGSRSNGQASAKAALSLNSTLLDGRFLIVSVSDPNARSRRKMDKYEERSRQQNATLFVPRVAAPKIPIKKQRLGTTGHSSDSSAPKSQDDFRQLLLSSAKSKV